MNFVIGMCLYAHLVASGDARGPHTDDDARAYARDCLIPDELLDRAHLDVEYAAAWLRLPEDELRLALAEVGGDAHQCRQVSGDGADQSPCSAPSDGSTSAR